ncbi:MAG: type II toxin-antitoxin system Phd/YefM family antitoxin [Vicinamibacteria bacterium]
MNSKTSIKPITYMKTNAADILATVSEAGKTVVITHNGEGKMVIQDIESYQSTMDTLAMLKLVALGKGSVLQGNVKTARKTFADIEKRRKKRRG